ncbi:Uracil-DNA glycosylase, family 4 [invertebrate metagenome]|uniref:Type-4 uracil-DNA glycosylase n=1 Tax=invertebrate metagenome TaxID=1711999 RepID=A0A484HAK2_9ZZZZ
MDSFLPPITLLCWYLESGVDEVVDEVPVDRYALSKLKTKITSLSLPKKDPSNTQKKSCSAGPFFSDESAAVLAAHCTTLEALRAAVTGFRGCSLRMSASHTVFSDGVPTAPVMVIGEAPGAEEDRQGLPFVGQSGQLLDRMLESIGLERRRNCYITNVVPWRPPGNRKPTSAEVSMLLPFLERHITLAAPQILLLVGGLSASVVLARNEGIMKLRGKWLEYSAGLAIPIPVIATFHPAYLLRSPTQKRFAWRDLLALQLRLQQLSQSAKTAQRR